MNKDGLVSNLRAGLTAVVRGRREFRGGRIWSVDRSPRAIDAVRLSIRPTPDLEPTAVELTLHEAKALARELKTTAHATMRSSHEPETFIPEDLLQFPVRAAVDYLQGQKLRPVVTDHESGIEISRDRLTGDEEIVAIQPPVERDIPIGSVVTITVRRPRPGIS